MGAPGLALFETLDSTEVSRSGFCSKSGQAQLRPFAREHPELTFPLDAIRCEVRLIDKHRWPFQAVSWLEWGSSTTGRIPLWLAEQEMNRLRHDYVPVNLKSETVPHPLQG
jgi:hypothetical protein